MKQTEQIHKRTVWLVVALSLPVLGRGDVLEFAATIDGEQAGDCAGTGSPATGSGTFSLDTDTGIVSYEITVDVDAMIGTELFAHVHGPAPRCESATILYDLPAGATKIGSGGLDEQGVIDMIRGEHYVNIHSTAVGPGELRGQIELVSPLAFRRGDSNVNRVVDISDPINTLNFLFTGTGQSPCDDATDANDDGVLDLTDAVHVLSFLFTGGPPPPAPGHMACGPDSTGDALDCALYLGCE